MSISNQLIERMEEIQLLTCLYFNLSIEELRSRSRVVKVAHPRMLAMYLVRRKTTLSLVEIGKGFGGRDHGTVIHACSRVRSAMRVDPSISELLGEILAGGQEAKGEFSMNCNQ